MTNIKRPFFLQLGNSRQHNHLDDNVEDNDDLIQPTSRQCENNKSDQLPSNMNGSPCARRPTKLKLISEKWHNNQNDSDQHQQGQHNRKLKTSSNSDRNSLKNYDDRSTNISDSGSCKHISQLNHSDSTSSSSLSSHNIRKQNFRDNHVAQRIKSKASSGYHIDSQAQLKKNRYSANSISSITSSSASSEFSSPSLSPSTSPTSNESPSQILPYLYVGDQAQTQIDTISSLNISYILSLQSLPKFLAKHEPDLHSEEVVDAQIDADDLEVETADTTGGSSTKGLLPSINSSTDYLVKIKSTSLDSDQIKQSSLVESSGGMQKNKSNDDSIMAEQKQPMTPIHEQLRPSTSSEVLDDSSNASDEQSKVMQPIATPRRSMIASTSQALTGRCNKISTRVQRLIRGKCINISDTFEQLLDKFFDEAHNFIEEARRNRCNILVHCKAGISRSPTIAIAYLMRWKRLHLQEAYNMVKSCRPQISPNLNFMGQLVSYERYLRCDNKSKLPSPITNCFPSPSSHSENINGSEENKRKMYRSSDAVRIAA